MKRKARTRCVHDFRSCKKNFCPMPPSDEFKGQTRFLIGSQHCAAEVFLKVLKSCALRPRSDSPLHFDMKNIQQIRTGQYNASTRRCLTLLPAGMLQHRPHVCRVKSTFEFLLNNWFFSTPKKLIKLFVEWIPFNIHVCLNHTQPCLEKFAVSTLKSY